MPWEPDEIRQPWVVAEELARYLAMTRPVWVGWGREEVGEIPLEEDNHLA